MTGKGWRPWLSEQERERLETPTSFGERLQRAMDEGILPDPGPCYFDKNGEPISFADWVEAFKDSAYKRVAEETVGEWWISTVWLGLDHRISLEPDTPPLIFETKVFEVNGEGELRGTDHYMNRYPTEAAALEGHREAVLAAEAGLIRREEEVEP